MPQSQFNDSLKKSHAQGIAGEVHEEAGPHKREFTRWMKAKLPHIKWAEEKSEGGGTADLIVYENTEDPKKWITYVWQNFCDNVEELEDAYEYAFAVMKTLLQPTEQPLTCKDNIAELMFYARKEGYKARWIMFIHKTPYLNQFIMTGPDGYKFETETSTWHPNCWNETKSELERIVNKDLGFTFDKINREAAKMIAEELRKSIQASRKG